MKTILSFKIFGFITDKIHFFLKKSIVIKLTLAEKQVNFKKKKEKKDR